MRRGGRAAREGASDAWLYLAASECEVTSGRGESRRDAAVCCCLYGGCGLALGEKKACHACQKSRTTALCLSPFRRWGPSLWLAPNFPFPFPFSLLPLPRAFLSLPPSPPSFHLSPPTATQKARFAVLHLSANCSTSFLLWQSLPSPSFFFPSDCVAVHSFGFRKN